MEKRGCRCVCGGVGGGERDRCVWKGRVEERG